MQDGKGDSLTKVVALSDSDLSLPKGTSFFDAYLSYYVAEMLQIGGESVVSLGSSGKQTGLFIYDPLERNGSVFTREREVFDFFFGYRSHLTLFSEIKTDHRSEPYIIYSLDMRSYLPKHGFSHEIKIIEEEDLGRVERYMVENDPRMNRRWVRVAFANGDKCFVVDIDNSVAGLGWLSFVRGIGRIHSLYVTPRFRKMGIGRDLLTARLMWLRAKGATIAFSEISKYNVPSTSIAVGEGMEPAGVIYQYFKKE
ncbi:MAG: GNAT family N-acetyltransferase [Candidatus Thermoplasmatota archaeon]|jgi:GNAT superfamily N-acetyltransferase|nr:GNAT family N-acetyltransferase [Candidatus Thermoplasmatota archaeon]MCL5788859.1 GNAT family N-acetyltransferase [Candidatus Thermoplasmatota archaeon]